MRAFRFPFVFLLAALLASLLTPSGALAHGALLTADPADGSVLPAAPAQIVLGFTEPVAPLAVTLVTATGERRSLDGVVASNDRVTVPLPAGLGRGTHLLSWRVTSADGHPIGGSMVFSVGEPGARPALTTGADPALGVAIWLVRALLYAALFLGAGMAVFGIVVAPLPGRLARGPLVAGLAGLLLAPLALALQGLDALDVGFSSLGSASVWSTALATSYGGTIIAAMAGFVAMALSVPAPRGPFRTTLALLAWAATTLAPVLSGHAGTAQPDWLSRPAVALHIAGLVFWIGALPPLWWLLRARDAAALSALRRFSTLIPFAVAPVVLSGIGLAVLQMGWPGPSWLTPYAYLLAAKLALLLPLFGLALWNRLALTGPVVSGGETAARSLRRSVAIELLLVLAIFGVVAGWRFTPPPRVVAEIAARPAEAHIHTGTAMAEIAVTPGRAGASTMSVYITDPDFAPLPLKRLGVALSNPALGVERLERQAVQDADGFWQVPLQLPSGGTWTVELALRIDDFRLERITGEIELAP